MPEKFSSGCRTSQVSPGDITIFCFKGHLNQNLNHKETSVPYNWNLPHLCLETHFYNEKIFERAVRRILYREGQTPSAFYISCLGVQSLLFCILFCILTPNMDLARLEAELPQKAAILKHGIEDIIPYSIIN